MENLREEVDDRDASLLKEGSRKKKGKECTQYICMCGTAYTHMHIFTNRENTVRGILSGRGRGS